MEKATKKARITGRKRGGGEEEENVAASRKMKKRVKWDSQARTLLLLLSASRPKEWTASDFEAEYRPRKLKLISEMHRLVHRELDHSDETQRARERTISEEPSRVTLKKKKKRNIFLFLFWKSFFFSGVCYFLFTFFRIGVAVSERESKRYYKARKMVRRTNPTRR